MTGRITDGGQTLDRCPPAYLSCASLARELDCSESTVHELVRKGVLPQPLRLSNGTVRWRWTDVDAALSSLNCETESGCDPFMEGVTMSKRRNNAAVVTMPRGVHPVVSRGRIYYYYQAGRGTPHAGPRIRLPDDPHSPKFWQAIRQAQGVVGPVPTDTINALIDAYIVTLAGAAAKA